MRNHTKLLLAALTTALVLAAGINTATARRIEISNTGIRIVWSELTFSSVSTGAGTDAICPVTLEGTLHSRTISKVSGQLIGFITSAHVNERSPPCTYKGGALAVRILNGNTGNGEEAPTTLPWHIRYDSFAGTLPNITRIRVQLVGAGFRLEVPFFAIVCLFKTTGSFPGFGDLNIGAGGVITNLTVLPERPIPLFEGRAGCPTQGFFRGTATVTLLGNTTSITVRLVQ